MTRCQVAEIVRKLEEARDVVRASRSELQRMARWFRR